MKKILLITSLITSLAGLSVFGQGYFQFATAKSQVYDLFSTGVPHTSTNVNVAFLWAAAGDVPMISSIAASTPITQTFYIWPGAAWNAILHDPNFSLALDAGGGNTVAVARSLATGACQYNSGTPFPVLSTVPSITYSLFMIGWDATYATPALAAAANGGFGAAVGWSSVFSYTPVTSTGFPTSFTSLTPAFGVGGIPEPTTLALAGLGGLTLWLFRRRKTQRQHLAARLGERSQAFGLVQQQTDKILNNSRL